MNEQIEHCMKSENFKWSWRQKGSEEKLVIIQKKFFQVLLEKYSMSGQEMVFKVFSSYAHTLIACCNLVLKAEHLEKP